MSWKIERIGTEEQILQRINFGLAGPVAVMIFGTNYDFKTNAYDAVIKSVINLDVAWERTVGMALNTAKFSLRAGKNVLFVMTKWGTLRHSERHLAVTKLREYGAKTIVGIVSPERLKEPITADGLDYLITIS